MRLIVTGGRNFFTDREALYAALDALQPAVVIHGGAVGADKIASQWAADRNCEQVIYMANWMRYGKRAGFERNTHMAQRANADAVLACPGGSGTRHMVNTAKAHGIRVMPLDGVELGF